MEHEKTVKDIERFIRKKTKGLNGGVIGLSGGIDSALVAFLAVRALGKDKVYGIMMPYGKQDTKDAEEVAQVLGIKYDIIDIKPAVDSFEKISPFYSTSLTKGNLMARARMCLLYGASNQQKKVVLGTTNKSEFHIGYYTVWGDGGVDLEPIIHLYKTEVREISKYLKVPQKIIEKVPSANLWEGQTDEGEIGITYAKLDLILKELIDNKKKPNEITLEGITQDEIVKIKNIVERNIFKQKLPIKFQRRKK